MSIITNQCPTGPLKYEECIAIFGTKIAGYLPIFIISAILGFLSCFIILKIKKREFNTLRYIIYSLIVSVIIFIILSAVIIYFSYQVVY